MTDTNELIEFAQAARENAVAPFTNYHVGAALQTADDTIVSGCNVESAISGLGSCAERTAILTALAEGHRKFTAIAIATEDGGTPGGACRQFIFEFCGDIPVHVIDDDENVKTYSIKELLPMAFTLKS